MRGSHVAEIRRGWAGGVRGGLALSWWCNLDRGWSEGLRVSLGGWLETSVGVWEGGGEWGFEARVDPGDPISYEH